MFGLIRDSQKSGSCLQSILVLQGFKKISIGVLCGQKRD